MTACPYLFPHGQEGDKGAEKAQKYLYSGQFFDIIIY